MKKQKEQLRKLYNGTCCQEHYATVYDWFEDCLPDVATFERVSLEWDDLYGHKWECMQIFEEVRDLMDFEGAYRKEYADIIKEYKWRHK